MQTLVQKLIDQGLENRVLTEKQLARVLEGSPQRGYWKACALMLVCKQKRVLLKDNSISNQLNLSFDRDRLNLKLKIKLEIDVNPPNGSGFDYSYLDYPLDFEVCHQDLAGQVVQSPRKGSLVLLLGHTWHRVLPIKGEFRFSTNFRVCPAGTPANITDICVYRNMRYSFSSNSVVEERETAS